MQITNYEIVRNLSWRFIWTFKFKQVNKRNMLLTIKKTNRWKVKIQQIKNNWTRKCNKQQTYKQINLWHIWSKRGWFEQVHSLQLSFPWANISELGTLWRCQHKKCSEKLGSKTFWNWPQLDSQSPFSNLMHNNGLWWFLFRILFGETLYCAVLT